MTELYTNKEERKVVIYDIYDGYEYAIISLGHHPCAYVLVGKGDKLYQKDIEDEWSDVVHGGITYCEDNLDMVCEKECEKWVLGWDYAHAGDYTTMNFIFPTFVDQDDWGQKNGKKWTIEEILNDVHSMIQQLKKCNNEG